MARREHPYNKTVRTVFPSAVTLLCLLAAGCVKDVRFVPSQMARGGKADVKVTLTYNRNNILQVQLANVPNPSSIQPQDTRYVLWTVTPDGRHYINIGQLRVDEHRRAQINTLTPLRSFRLLITAEASGDVLTPGPDQIFHSGLIQW